MAVYSQCKICNEVKNLNDMAQYSLCYICEAQEKKQRRLTTIELRHLHYRRHGKVCVRCKENRPYDQYKINAGTNRITETKPCLVCLAEAKLHPCPRCLEKRDIKEYGRHVNCKTCRNDMRDSAGTKICPMCKISKRKAVFGPGAKCRQCRLGQRLAFSGIRCKICEKYKSADLFVSDFECLQCFDKAKVKKKCKICIQPFPVDEMIAHQCIYCAMRRGAPPDIYAISLRMQKDENLASKISEFMEVQQSSFVRD